MLFRSPRCLMVLKQTRQNPSVPRPAELKADQEAAGLYNTELHRATRGPLFRRPLRLLNGLSRPISGPIGVGVFGALL